MDGPPGSYQVRDGQGQQTGKGNPYQSFDRNLKNGEAALDVNERTINLKVGSNIDEHDSESSDEALRNLQRVRAYRATTSTPDIPLIQRSRHKTGIDITTGSSSILSGVTSNSFLSTPRIRRLGATPPSSEQSRLSSDFATGDLVDQVRNLDALLDSEIMMSPDNNTLSKSLEYRSNFVRETYREEDDGLAKELEELQKAEQMLREELDVFRDRTFSELSYDETDFEINGGDYRTLDEAAQLPLREEVGSITPTPATSFDYETITSSEGDSNLNSSKANNGENNNIGKISRPPLISKRSTTGGDTQPDGQQHLLMRNIQELTVIVPNSLPMTHRRKTTEGDLQPDQKPKAEAIYYLENFTGNSRPPMANHRRNMTEGDSQPVTKQGQPSRRGEDTFPSATNSKETHQHDPTFGESQPMKNHQGHVMGAGDDFIKPPDTSFSHRQIVAGGEAEIPIIHQTQEPNSSENMLVASRLETKHRRRIMTEGDSKPVNNRLDPVGDDGGFVCLDTVSSSTPTRRRFMSEGESQPNQRNVEKRQDHTHIMNGGITNDGIMNDGNQHQMNTQPTLKNLPKDPDYSRFDEAFGPQKINEDRKSNNAMKTLLTNCMPNFGKVAVRPRAYQHLSETSHSDANVTLLDTKKWYSTSDLNSLKYRRISDCTLSVGVKPLSHSKKWVSTSDLNSLVACETECEPTPFLDRSTRSQHDPVGRAFSFDELQSEGISLPNVSTGLFVFEEDTITSSKPNKDQTFVNIYSGISPPAVIAAHPMLHASPNSRNSVISELMEISFVSESDESTGHVRPMRTESPGDVHLLPPRKNQIKSIETTPPGRHAYNESYSLSSSVTSSEIDDAVIQTFNDELQFGDDILHVINGFSNPHDKSMGIGKGASRQDCLSSSSPEVRLLTYSDDSMSSSLVNSKRNLLCENPAENAQDKRIGSRRCRGGLIVCLSTAVLIVIVTVSTIFARRKEHALEIGLTGPIYPSMPAETLTFLPSSTQAPHATSNPLQTQFPSTDQDSSDFPSSVASLAPQTSPTVDPSYSPTVSTKFEPAFSPSMSHSFQPSRSPSVSPTVIDKEIFNLLASVSLDGGDALKNQTTPQNQAYRWLASSARVKLYSESRLIQRYVLATFYFSTGGRDWVINDSWLSDDFECNWFTKSRLSPCDAEGRFQDLHLYYNNMRGKIPPEIALLSNSLVSINFAGGPQTGMDGTLPTEIGLLTLMNELWLQNNLFSGTIPTQIAQLSLLNYFSIANNLLTGIIPSEIGSLSDISQLVFKNNMLEGPIPTDIAKLSALRVLSLSNNYLTSIPTQLGSLNWLFFLDLHDNAIGGTLITEIGNLASLRSFTMHQNNLNGPLPAELGTLASLSTLDLSNNAITGSIPDDFISVKNRLRTIRLRGNSLTGSVPESFQYLELLNTLALNNNDLIGTVPIPVCEVFNRTIPAVFIDCEEITCPCCNFCCHEDLGCQCRYLNTSRQWMCY